MKQGSRVLGVDDGPREVEKLIGVVYRGTEFIEQVEIINQEADTGSSTKKILELYNSFNQYIEAIILDGVSFNGFNVANIEKISSETGKPVIAVTKNKPNKDKMRKGLVAAGLETDIIDSLPETHNFGDIFIQFSGCDLNTATEIVEESTLQGVIPEAVRSAHLIGRGITQS